MPKLTELSPEDLLGYLLRNDQGAWREALSRMEQLEKCNSQLTEVHDVLIGELDPNDSSSTGAVITLARIVRRELLATRAQHALQVLDNQKLKERLEKCEALCEYAQHHPVCAWLESSVRKPVPCSCGYDAALSALEK